MKLKNIFISRPYETITNKFEIINKNYRIFLKKLGKIYKKCKKN